MHVIVEKYNPDWKTQFQKIKNDLEQYLSNVSYISIEHVGSTSVPGLAAKPVIDIDIIIKPENLNDCIRELEECSEYKYVGECGVQDRHAFKKPGAIPKSNVYVCVENCQALKNHLAIRNECIKDSRIRDKYSEWKLDLAKKDWKNVDEYCEAKNDIIELILIQAGFTEEETRAIRQVNTITA